MLEKDTSWIPTQDEDKNKVYKVHQLVQYYAKEQLELPVYTDDLLGQYQARYQEFTIDVLTELNKQATGHWKEWVLDIPHIEQVKWQLEQIEDLNTLENLDLERILRFAVLIERYLEQRIRKERLEWLKKGLTISDRLGNTRKKAFFHFQLAEYFKNNPEDEEKSQDTRENYDAALEIYQSENDKGGQALVYVDQAAYYRIVEPSNITAIRDLINNAYSLLEQIDDQENLYRVLVKLGEVSQGLDNTNTNVAKSTFTRERGSQQRSRLIENIQPSLPSPQDFYSKALAIADQVDEDAKRIDLYKKLSDLAQSRRERDFEIALKYFEKYFELAGEAVTSDDNSP